MNDDIFGRKAALIEATKHQIEHVVEDLNIKEKEIKEQVEHEWDQEKESSWVDKVLSYIGLQWDLSLLEDIKVTDFNLLRRINLSLHWLAS